jgi:hypothetical protein
MTGFEDKMKRLVLATAIGSLMACGGSSPIAPTPPANIAGSYIASVTASSTCSANLPSATRVLNYAADVAQTGATAQVQINPHGGTTVTVAGTVSGQTINFPSVSFSGTTPGGAVSIVATTGTANVAANGEIAGTLSGTYQAAGTSCNAGNHQLQMRRCVVTCSGNVCACL